MKTAIILVTTLVIAVIGILAFFRKCKKIREEAERSWERKWNEERKHDICDNDCLWCSNSQFCKLKDRV